MISKKSCADECMCDMSFSIWICNVTGLERRVKEPPVTFLIPSVA